MDMIEGELLIDELMWLNSIKTSKVDRVPTIRKIILIPKFIHVVAS